MARLWSARYYGVARQRAGRAKTASGLGPLAAFRPCSLYPLSRAAKMARQKWFQPARRGSPGLAASAVLLAAR